MASVMLVDFTESPAPPKFYCVPCAAKSGAMEDELEHSTDVENVVCCVCGLRIVDLPSPPLNRYDVVVCLHFTEVVASNPIEAVALVVEPIEAEKAFEVTSASIIGVDD